MGGIISLDPSVPAATKNAFHSVGSRKNIVKSTPAPAELVIIPLIKSFEASPQIIQVISDNLKSVDECDEDKKTALMWAVEKGRQDIIEKLIANNAQIEKKDSDGWTPVMYAARRGNVAVFKYLMNQGALLTNVTKSDGFTALHLACGNECIDMAEALIEYGADSEVKDKTNHTPLYYIRGKDKEKLHAACAKLQASGVTPSQVRNKHEEQFAERHASRKMEEYVKVGEDAVNKQQQQQQEQQQQQ